MNVLKSLLVISSLLFLSACLDDDDDNPKQPDTVVDAAIQAGNFTTLVTLLQNAELVTTLQDTDKKFTVFAPTDRAFELLGADKLAELSDAANKSTLTNVLTYHVYDGEVDEATAITKVGEKLTMLNQDMVGVSSTGTRLLINTATVTTANIKTGNGIIHVIDAVLMPPAEMNMPANNIVETAIAAGNFTTLVSLLERTGLDNTLANASTDYTVFAPTDAAFASIAPETLEILAENPSVLESILLQHVVVGKVDSVTAYTLNGNDATTASSALIPVAINDSTDKITFGGASVSAADIYTSNGVIHVIDSVVVADVTIPANVDTVYDVALASDDFNTLVTALDATGLDVVLDDVGADFTVFAPTDAAFALIGTDALNNLLANTDQLKDILLYHVISGTKVMQDGAITVAGSSDKNVTMANSEAVTLSVVDQMLYVNQSLVSTANIMSDNAVIHAVDQVIMPFEDKATPTQSIVDIVTSDDNFSTLEAALIAASLVDDLQVDGKVFTVFAPTNAAFDKIEDGTLTNLLANTADLTDVLLQHVIEDAEIDALTAYGANGTSVNTMADEDVTVKLVNFTKTTNTTDDEVAYDAVNQMLVGGAGAGNMAGKTLYVFDNDLGAAGSACNDTCATNWPPVLVTDDNVDNIPGLSIITRDDNSKQVAYLGRPLYYYINDAAAGDMNGQGLGDNWWVVKQDQVSLQIQDANVTQKNIYTTNGVIHVIDTVITETLAP